MGDNKQTVQRMFGEIINDGDLALIDELFDPSFVSNGPTGPMDRDAFRQFVAGWRAAFPDIHCEVGDLIAEGDRVAWSVRATGTQEAEFMGIPATGRSIDFDSLNIGTFTADGKAVSHHVVMDMVTMLTQLGVMPAPSAA